MSYIVPREKPKCYNCPFRTLDYCGLLIEHDCVTVNVNEMTVSKYCPLVELPPHGRLGDLDELYKVANMADDFGADTTDILKLIIDTHAVIEAEGSET